MIPLDVRLNFPVALRLRLEGDKIEKRAGQGVARVARKELRKGNQADGKPMPKGKDGGEPLKDSGKLIGSVKYRPKLGWVSPSTNRREDASRRAWGNFGLMGIYLHTHDTDPLALGDEAVKVAERNAQKEIDKQLREGSGGLIADLKRIRRGRF